MYIELAENDSLSTGSLLGAARAGWNAELELGFASSRGKTVLSRRRHVGPLLVQRSFYPEGPVCHVYLLHPPGGVVAGDTLMIDVSAENDSAALVTTPAAGKFYRSAGAHAEQSVTLRVAPNASLEWLPQETIFFEGARVTSSLKIHLEPGARFIGWDIIALGRPAAGEGFAAGAVDLNLSVMQTGQPCLLERTLMNPEAFQAVWGLNGLPTFGTLLATPCRAEHLEAVRELIGDHPERGATRIGDLLICRARDPRADRIRSFFQQVWGCIRLDVVGHKACAPRIWAT